MNAKTRRAPKIHGVNEARIRDAFQIIWWLQLGFQHGARKGASKAAAFSGFLALIWWVEFPLLLGSIALSIGRRNVRYYMSVDSVIAVRSSRKGWHIENHSSRCPGSGQGAQLRQMIMPQLAAVADNHGITIMATAANKTLASVYSRDSPGLEDVGRAFPRGRRMRRLPESAYPVHPIHLAP